MRRLSSMVRPRAARWYAVAAMGVVVVVVVAAALTGHTRSLLGWLAPVVAIVIAVPTALGVLPLPPRDALDGAWLDGEDVLLRRGSQTLRAPLAHIAAVDSDRGRTSSI